MCTLYGIIEYARSRTQAAAAGTLSLRSQVGIFISLQYSVLYVYLDDSMYHAKYVRTGLGMGHWYGLSTAKANLKDQCSLRGPIIVPVVGISPLRTEEARAKS